MLKVRILARLNSQYGTFEAGDIVVNLPDEVATAWIEAGIAEIPVRAAAEPPPTPDKPELDDLILEEEPARRANLQAMVGDAENAGLYDRPEAELPADDQPVRQADLAGKRSSRKRVPATHPSGHEGPMREDPKR